MPDTANMPAGVPGGGIPAGAGQNPLAQAPANVGPVAVPQGNRGNVAAGMAGVEHATDLLQKQLPLLPFGSPLHDEIMTFLNKIKKVLKDGGGNNEALKMQAGMQSIKGNAENGPLQAMMKMFPAQQPNAGPALPQPQPGTQAA